MGAVQFIEKKQKQQQKQQQQLPQNRHQLTVVEHMQMLQSRRSYLIWVLLLPENKL